jgi:hypothetical protein
MGIETVAVGRALEAVAWERIWKSERGENRRGKSNATSSVADSERSVQALRRPAGPQRFCTQDEIPHAVEADRRTRGPQAPRWER